MSLQQYLTLAQYDQSLQSLAYGNTPQAQMPHEKGELAQTLHAWWRFKTRQPCSEQQQAAWPHMLRQQWQGWQHYYMGAYVLAHAHFMQAWHDPEREQSLLLSLDTALGFAKVYTRTGHWSAAHKWLLWYLHHARQQQDMFAVVQGYGALGELFLRADHGQAAMACLNTAFHLLPIGSGQQAKQLNYLASALMRHQEWMRAEGLLQHGLNIAQDQWRLSGQGAVADSLWHALMRLQFLRYQQPTSDTSDDICAQYAELIDQLPRDRAKVAQGFLYIGQALTAIKNRQTAHIEHALQQAAQRLGSAYPVERAWVARLQQNHSCCPTIQSEQHKRIASALAQITLQPCVAPPVHCVLDQTWQHYVLPENSVFAQWLRQPVDAETDQNAWKLFFI